MLKIIEKNEHFPPQMQKKILSHYRAEEVPLQSTLRNEVKARGKGKTHHKPIEISLKPAPINTGIVFRRMDVTPAIVIPAELAHADVYAESTVLTRCGTTIQNVDHILSALSGLKIDNVFINIDGPELPSMGDSAEAFIFLIQSAGVSIQSALKRFICVKETFSISQGPMWMSIEPSKTFEIRCVPHDDFKSDMAYGLTVSPRLYTKELGRARHSVSLNTEKHLLRYPNESARHTVLDLIGRTRLLSPNLQGLIQSYRATPSFHLHFLEGLLNQSDRWHYSENNHESVKAFEQSLSASSYC